MVGVRTACPASSPSTPTAVATGTVMDVTGERAIPAGSGPVGDAFLYWDQTADGESHLAAYDMTTNGKSDLSGEADESDFTAAWSPDSQWIAMTWAGLTTTADGTALQEGVWLIRSNGTQARQLFSEAGGFLEGLQWSPDGRDLLYARNGDAGTIDIRFGDVQTGQETALVEGGQQPVWLSEE